MWNRLVNLYRRYLRGAHAHQEMKEPDPFYLADVDYRFVGEQLENKVIKEHMTSFIEAEMSVRTNRPVLTLCGKTVIPRFFTTTYIVQERVTICPDCYRSGRHLKLFTEVRPR